MLSKILTKPPATCGDCELYEIAYATTRPMHGTCAHFRRVVYAKLLCCDSRLNWNRVEIRANMIAASAWLSTPKHKRKAHGIPRQKPLL